MELWESPTDEEHVQTYLWLGRSYKQKGRTHDMRACYEMGLLIALHARNLHSEYTTTELKDQFDILEHSLLCQMIIYHQHASTVFHRDKYVVLQCFANRPEQKKTNNNHLSYSFLFYGRVRPVAS